MIRRMGSGDINNWMGFGFLLRRTHYAVLLAALLLATQIGCVSPPDAQDASQESETEEEQQRKALQAEVAALENQLANAQAATGAAQAMAEDTRVEAEAAQAEIAAIEAESAAAIAAAQAALTAAEHKVAAMESEAHRPSEVMIAADRIDPDLLSLDHARVSVAGPESIYLSGIKYGDDTYSALLRYRGGTTATVERIFGPDGKLIPDSVDLSHTELSLDGLVVDVANVGVGGNGYSGQLRYAGDNRLEVVGIRSVTLPPTADERVAQAQARAATDIADARAVAEAEIAEARAAADAKAAKAHAAADAAVAEAEARLANVEAEAAAAIAAAQAALTAAEHQVAAMESDAHRPSEVMIAADDIDPGLLSLDHARVSVAGPESIYLSRIKYGDDTYSALLRYRGGTTATVERIFGRDGKLIPDSVDLSHTELSLDGLVVDVANVGVGGDGYSAQLRYAGDNRLEVVGIRSVTLPPTADERVAEAQARAATDIADARAVAEAEIAEAEARLAKAEAEAAAAIAEAQAALTAAEADADAARAEIDTLRLELTAMGGVVIPRDLDMRRLNLDSAIVSIAGPDSIYVAGIGYDTKEYSVRLRHTGGNTGIADKVFDAAERIMPALDLSAPAVEAVAHDTLVISNVGIGGAAYAVSFQARPDGDIVITPRSQGRRVRTAGELLRDHLLEDPAASWMVSGFDEGYGTPERRFLERHRRRGQPDRRPGHACQVCHRHGTA